MITLIS